MTTYEEIKATLDSPGAKYILRALRAYHKAQWREYRRCKTEIQLAKVQTTQVVIDTVIPDILEQLLNAHIPKDQREKAKKNKEWWHWREWYDKEIKVRIRMVDGQMVCEQREIVE